LLVIDTGGWYKLCCPSSQLQQPEVLGGIYRISKNRGWPIKDPRGLKLAWDKMTPKELAALLGDTRPAVRSRAQQALAKKGADAVPALKETIRDDNPQTRLSAVWTATRIDGADARALVRAALTDSDETVRQAAIH